MKLIRCHIGNFGCLSSRTFHFEAGLNPIQAPNGSGKTTLCEFLRAMLYGFPRTASTSLEKNRRRKYLPWQGGLCGGSLLFEHEGISWRVERTFGEKPAQDTFALYDLSAGRKSDRFSPDLGTELFGLDADSFERSTYLPQLGDRNLPPATDRIQARLGSLVEQTDQDAGFETAVKLLRSRRAELTPYRGQSGQVPRAREQILRLEEQLQQARDAVPRLEQCQAQRADTQVRREAAEQNRLQVQEDLRQASEASGRAAVAQRQTQLEQDLHQARTRLDRILARYPQGLPEESQVEAALEAADAQAALHARLEPNRACREARTWLEERRDRFQRGIPSEEAFTRCREQCAEYTRIRAARDAEHLSREEELRLQELERLFAPGVPDTLFLDQVRTASRTVQQLESLTASDGLLPEDEARFRRLESFFAPGVPSGEDLARHSEALQQEAPASPAERPSILLPALALLLALAGLALLVADHLLPGLVLLAAGSLLAVRTFSSRHTGAVRSDPDGELIAWLDTWFSDDRPPAEQLSLLRTRREEFLTLRARREALLRRDRSRRDQLQSARTWLTDHLGPYFGTPVPPDAPMRLQLACREYQTLRQKQADTRDEVHALDDQLDGLAQAISEFLHPYEGRVEPEAFSERLTALQRDCDTCRHNRDLVLSWESERTRSLRDLEQQEQILAVFSRTWGVPAAGRADLESIRDDLRQAHARQEEIRTLEQALADFQAEHRAFLSASPAPARQDPEALRAADRQLEAEISTCTAALLDLDQQIRSLQEQTDRIPLLEDELLRWQEIRNRGKEQSALLDQTISFLQQAKDALSARYLGPLQDRFGRYLQRLTREDPERAALHADLTVSLDRGGRLREAGSFSSGEADLLQLCMRLALVDALFPQVQPFLMLDDPFVNLDDRNTETALTLLQDLARERQILYLYCHSSRELPGHAT